VDKKKVILPEDLHFMQLALRLARRGYPAPNPHVGAVVVKSSRIIAQGYHAYAGGPHAEVAALRKAGDDARGATLYVTLEPCCHFGRTPPCTEAIIQHGIKRVVVSSLDPNPMVSGQGIKCLKSAGIEVEVGIGDEEALKINEIFYHFHRLGRPFVTLKAAMTLDGKIASYTGDSQWITSPSARRIGHQLRAEHGAVLIGRGTALKDDPELTARVPRVKNQPIRIVLDEELDINPDAKLLNTILSPTLIATCSNDPERVQKLTAKGAEVIHLPQDAAGQISLPSLLMVLGKRGITGVLVEGGGETLGSFVEQKLFDKVAFFYAPKLLGGRNAKTAIEGQGFQSVAEAIELREVKIKKIGGDWLVTGYPVTDLSNEPD